MQYQQDRTTSRYKVSVQQMNRQPREWEKSRNQLHVRQYPEFIRNCRNKMPMKQNYQETGKQM